MLEGLLKRSINPVYDGLGALKRTRTGVSYPCYLVKPYYHVLVGNREVGKDVIMVFDNNTGML